MRYFRSFESYALFSCKTENIKYTNCRLSTHTAKKLTFACYACLCSNLCQLTCFESVISVFFWFIHISNRDCMYHPILKFCMFILLYLYIFTKSSWSKCPLRKITLGLFCGYLRRFPKQLIVSDK